MNSVQVNDLFLFSFSKWFQTHSTYRHLLIPQSQMMEKLLKEMLHLKIVYIIITQQLTKAWGSISFEKIKLDIYADWVYNYYLTYYMYIYKAYRYWNLTPPFTGIVHFYGKRVIYLYLVQISS